MGEEASSATLPCFLVSAGEGDPFSWGEQESAASEIRSFRLPLLLPWLTQGCSLRSGHRKFNSAVGNQPTMATVLPSLWNRKEIPF